MKVESIDGVKTQYVFKRQLRKEKNVQVLWPTYTYNEM